MNQSNLDESGKQFLLQLFKASNGDVSTKVSMYEIGETLGWIATGPILSPLNWSVLIMLKFGH
jgi:hypothetical protein